jgi:hypothetical protein
MKTKEDIREYDREWRKRNVDKSVAISKRYNLKLKQDSARSSVLRDKRNKRRRKWRLTHRDAERQRLAEWYRKSGGSTPERRKKYRMSVINCLHKRRAVYKKSDITSNYLKALWEDTTHCILCGKQMNDNSKYPDGKELDHIIPLCINGTHTINNVRYICSKCNRTRPRDGSDL